MSSFRSRHWPLVTLAAIAVYLCILLLSACSKDPESAQVTPAKVAAADLVLNARLIEFKTKLQQDPFSADAHFGLGQALLEQGDPWSAEREFSRAVELGLNPNLAMPALARTWNTLGRSKELIEKHGDSALSDGQAAADFKVALALAYANTGEPQRARDLAAAALKDNPRSGRALILTAQIALADGRVDDALRSVDEALGNESGLAEAHELKGDILWLVRGDRESGIAAYEAALKIQPRYSPIHAKLITADLQAGNLTSALDRLNTLKAAAPNSLPAMFFTARVQYAQRELTTARNSIQRTLTVYPKDLRSLLLGAEIELKIGSPREAEEYLSTALIIAPALPRVRHLLATTYLRLGVPVKAQLILEPLIRSKYKDSVALGLAAEAALQSGATLIASRLFEQAAAADPANPRFKSAVAISKIAKGDVAGGIEDLESAAAVDKSAYSDLALVSARLRSGDVTAAIRAAEGVARKRPNDPMPELVLGKLKLRSNSRTDAREHFERAIGLDKAYIPAAVALAQMDLEVKDLTAARRRFEGVLEVNPKNLDALLALAEIQLRAGGAVDQVTANLNSIVASHSDQGRSWLALIDHLIRIGDSGAALLTAQRANVALPEDVTVIDALGRAQLAAGESAQALTTFRKIVTLRPRAASPHMRMAEVYAKRNEIDSAVDSLKQVLRLQPSSREGLIRLTGLLSVKKNWAEALRVARKAQEMRPQSPLGFHLEGLVHAAQKRWDPAFAAFKSAAQRGESSELTLQWHKALLASDRKQEADQLAKRWMDKQPRDSMFVGYLGELALSNGDFATAEPRFRAVLQNEPDNVEAMNNLAWVLQAQSKPEAVTLAQKVVALRPQRADFLDTLSMALAQDNQLPAALASQKKAIELAPNAPLLRLNLARLAVRSGDFALAKAQLDGLSALGKEFPQQSEVWRLRQQLQ